MGRLGRLLASGAALLLVAGCAGASGFPNAGKPTTIETRPGVQVKLIQANAPNPSALVIMLPGGDGVLAADGPAADFQPRLVAQGLSVAVMGPPSDHESGLSPRFRETPAHLRDLEAVIAHYRKSTRLPIWLWGISRSTLSVLYAATHASVRPDGFIVLSSVTRIPPRAVDTPILSLPLGRVREPIYAAGSAMDACPGSPPGGAARIVALAVNASRKESRIFSGGYSTGRNPCGPGTGHTFEGIQNTVAAAIARFVKG